MAQKMELFPIETGEQFSKLSHLVELNIKKALVWETIKLLEPIDFIEDPWFLNILDNPQENAEFKNYVLSGVVKVFSSNQKSKETFNLYSRTNDIRILRIMRLVVQFHDEISLLEMQTLHTKQVLIDKITNGEQITEESIDAFLTQNNITTTFKKTKFEAPESGEQIIEICPDCLGKTFSSSVFYKKQIVYFNYDGENYLEVSDGEKKIKDIVCPLRTCYKIEIC